MNEWKQLLEQTHPKFKSAITVEQAIHQETLVEDTSAQNEESEIVEAPKEAVASANNEIEWISPTYKLQDKIENIPDKFGFKIGEAADYVGVKQYVLRYWESEFDQLKPKKSKNGQRMYTKKDVEMALMIKKLLHDDRFSIEGAQAAIKRLRQQVRDKDKEKDKVMVANDPAKVSQLGGLDFAQAMLESIRQARLNLNL